MKKYKALKSNLFLMLTAFIWGTGFVAQSLGVEQAGPFSFNAARNFLGSIALIPVILLFGKKSDNKANKRKDLIIGGIFCGLALGIASALQILGISLGTSSGKAGFITALYMLIVPFFGLFLHKNVGAKAWLAVLFGIAGMYFLCLKNNGFALEKGDFVMLLCAVGYAVHILVIDYFSPKADGVKMSCIQFFVSGVVNVIIMLFFEELSLTGLVNSWKPLLYLGIFSSGVAYTLQIIAQKDTSPVAATLIMSLESVFAVLSGWLILKEGLTSDQLIGCLLIFVGIILSQLPSKAKEKAMQSL